MLNRTKSLVFIIFIIFAFSSCKFELPTSPNSLGEEEKNGAIKTWDPYIGVHPFGFDAGLQQQHLLKLIQAGVLRGVRMGNLGNPETQRFVNWFQFQGVEVLGLFDNKFLREPNVCQILSQIIAQNQGIKVIEIGNEVRGFVNMSPEEYMRIATLLFYYAKQYHPDVKLAIGAVAGNGSSADDLRRMIDAGLDQLCHDGLEIVPIHFYSRESTRLQEFKSQIDKLPASTRIWITETNDMPPSWNTQIGYITEMYPKFGSVKAERKYFYTFAEESASEFSLVRGLVDGGPILYSPLMNLLIGADETNSALIDTTINPVFLENMLLMPPDKKREKNPVRENPRKRKQQ